MEIFIKENGFKERLKAKVYINMQMEDITKENGRMIINKDMGFKYGKTVANMKEILIKGWNMDMDFIHGSIIQLIRGNGKKIRLTEKEFIVI